MTAHLYYPHPRPGEFCTTTLGPGRYDPHAHAQELGVRVEYHPLRASKGLWVPEHRLILLRPRMRPFIERAVLTHECMHAMHDDPPGHDPKREARANLEAARRLIDPREWAELTRIYPDYDRICMELGVTREMFRAYADYTESEYQIEYEGAA